tara:strand:+ start:34 stop:591 length:558 start_codon:yes stop_codon:yes gene_type:complete
MPSYKKQFKVDLTPAGVSLDINDRNITNESFLQPISFQFQCPKTPNMNYFVQSVQIPAVESSPATQPTALIPSPLPGQDFTYNPLSVNFIIDENMNNWIEVYNWMLSTKATDRFDRVVEPDDQFADATVIVMNNKMQPMRRVEFYRIFPTGLTEIQFDSTNTDPGPIIATATFAYTFYEVSEKLP